MNRDISISLSETIAISIIAVLLRLAVFVVASWLGNISLAGYTSKADTTSYIAYASAMIGERSYQSLEAYDRRVFPGYPALIAVVHLTKIPLPLAALLVTWISTGITVFATARFFEDRRVAYAMLCLIPHYLINSSIGMSEAPLLAAITLGLLLAKYDRSWSAGILLGFAGLIRPMACFAGIGLVVAHLIRRDRKAADRVAMMMSGVFLAGFLVIQHWTGDALQGTRVYAHHPGAYGGHLFLLPFQSLIQTPFQEPTATGRIIYTWLHVLITLIACTLSISDLRTRSPHSALCTLHSALIPTWLCANTLFVLCIGSAWGFRHFPRFSIPAEPAMFWVLRRWFPQNRFIWLIIIASCFIFAVIGVENSP